VPGVVSVYNPLPRALRHFEDELVSVVTATGRTMRRATAPSAEISGASHVEQVRALGRDLVGRLRASRTTGELVVCWPVLGLAEPALWCSASPDARITLLVHDPVPLRRQVGMGQGARWLGRVGTRHRAVQVAVHSAPAREALVGMGWPAPVLLPHPLIPRPAPTTRADGDVVLVCGQYKPARDLGLLERLGASLRERGFRPLIRGRGWPAVAGWEVHEGFLAEDALDASLAASAAVLIPYAHFFQSGVAVRAVEVGTPVVGPRHPFLVDLLGAGWPGLAATEATADWVEAVAAVRGRTAEMQERALLLRTWSEQAWDAHLR
jgi:hypothetical protein